MFRDHPYRLLWIGLALVAIGLVWAGTAITALAQCGDNPSSCLTCHAKSDPVYDKGEWHQIHARQDICWNCHAGNTQAQDKTLAHVGLVTQPLGDTYLSCHACHPDDYPMRAARFGVRLGITPQSELTPTPRPTIVARGQTAIVLPTAAPLTDFVPMAMHLVWPLLLIVLVLVVWVVARRHRVTS